MRWLGRSRGAPGRGRRDPAGPPLTDTHPAPLTVDRRSLARLLGVSTRTLDRMRQDRGFPRPLTPPDRRPLWARPVVDRWLSTPR